MDDITTKTLAIVTIVKILVDMVKIANPNIQTYVPPLAATIFGILTAILLDMASGTALNGQSIATSILAGILAAGGAIGVTELQKRA